MNMWIAVALFAFFFLLFLGIGVEKENYVLIFLACVNFTLTIVIFAGCVISENITDDKSIIEKHPITQIKTIQKGSENMCIVYCGDDEKYELNSLSKDMKECEDEPYYEDYYKDYYTNFCFFKLKVKDKYPSKTFYIPKDIYNSIKYNGSIVTYYNYDTKEE